MTGTHPDMKTHGKGANDMVTDNNTDGKRAVDELTRARVAALYASDPDECGRPRLFHYVCSKGHVNFARADNLEGEGCWSIGGAQMRCRGLYGPALVLWSDVRQAFE